MRERDADREKQGEMLIEIASKKGRDKKERKKERSENAPHQNKKPKGENKSDENIYVQNEKDFKKWIIKKIEGRM